MNYNSYKLYYFVNNQWYITTPIYTLKKIIHYAL